MSEPIKYLQNFLNQRNKKELSVYNINIGGISLAIHSVKDKLQHYAIEKYDEFLTQKKADREVIILNTENLPNADEIRKEFDIYKELTTRKEGNNFIVFRWDFFGVIDLNSLSSKFIHFLDAFMSYESIIRIIYSLLTVKNNGFLMHSSSLIHEGNGYLFFGVSGSGKSTVVKLSEPDICLSDELSMIIKQNGRYIISGTPFHGELPIYSNKQIGLQNAFLLKKNKTTYFTKLDSVDAYTHIMRNILFFSNDWSLKQIILKTTVDLVRSVDIYEMNFEKNNKFWKIIDNGFNENYSQE